MKKKIAIIGLKGTSGFGGASAMGEAIIKELQNNFDFYVYSLSTHAEKSKGNEGYHQIIFNEKKVGGFATLKYYLKAAIHAMFLSRYDLIHLHHAESGFVTGFLKLKYKVVTTFHGIFYNKHDPKFNYAVNKFFRISEKLNLILSNIVISVSQKDREDIKKHYRKEVRYIPNGVKVNLRPKEQMDYLLFAAARIYEIKGLHILLSAIKKCPYDLKLIVAGDLDQNPEYKKHILQQAQGLNIEFKGLIRDKMSLYELINNAKLFVFPSVYEAMSVMLLEAAAHSTPVIASDIPANLNVFNNSEVTFFESNNPKDLAAKITYVIDHYNEAIEKSKKASKILTDNYSWSVIASQYNNIYKELLM